jgi:DNA-directed RNA polymerase specialized sigma54-like protein
MDTMFRELRLANRLLQASCSEVGKIIGEELGDANLFAAQLLEGPHWGGPDIRVRGPRGRYTVEICNEPFSMLNLDIDDAPCDKGGSPTVEMLPLKVRTLIKALSMRQQTLRRVAESFLSLQYSVPHRPSDRFKPVSLWRIAEGAALHESTVEKAVANKAIEIAGQRIAFDSLVVRPGREQR